jgi:AcrR family transcriptional regulator
MEKRYHHGDLKTQLIKAGLRMIQEEGIKKLSLRKLAQICDVSEAAPYSHFKNKEELLISIQSFIAEQLTLCLKNAYESTENSNSPQAIFNMGVAYIRFFISYPEYYSFIFNQSCLNIDLTDKLNSDEFEPFRYYKEKAYQIYKNIGMSDERIKYGVIAMWAKVHGIASIASMKGINKDFEWEDVLDKILVE